MPLSVQRVKHFMRRVQALYKGVPIAGRLHKICNALQMRRPAVALLQLAVALSQMHRRQRAAAAEP